MMRCPDDNTLVEYVEGLLPAEQRLAADRHVDTCEACRRQLAWFAHTGSLHVTSPSGVRLRPHEDQD
jgi:anti-sigma factor RsiW